MSKHVLDTASQFRTYSEKSQCIIHLICRNRTRIRAQQLQFRSVSVAIDASAYLH